MRIVHTSDANIGRRFPHLDKRTESLRTSDLAAAFSQVIDFSISKKADILIVSGNLFDKRNPDRSAVAFAVAEIMRLHKALPAAHIVLTPSADEISISPEGRFESSLTVFESMPFVTIAGSSAFPETSRIKIKSRQICITAAMPDFFMSPDFTKKALTACREAFGIFVMSARTRRGALVTDDRDIFEHRILDPLQERGYRYAAFGGLQGIEITEHASLLAVFPGTTERLDIARDRDRKHFVSITVDDSRITSVEKIRIKTRPVENIAINCSTATKAQEIDNHITDSDIREHKDKIVVVSLNGNLLHEQFDAFRNGTPLATFASRFAAVHIENNLVLLETTENFNFDSLRVGTPAEEFTRTVEREIAESASTGAEARLLRKLLEMGIREIQEEA